MTGRIWLLLFFTVLVSHTFSQKGSLSGIVKDKKTGETLPGVNVIISGTTLGASTDLNGEYTIHNIPVGRHTVIASCLSFESDTARRVDIPSGKITSLNFSITEKVSTIQGVTIVAKKRTDTDISMMSTIKQSNLVINGISAQQIGRSLDKDAAEVVRRVPGITIMDDRFVVVRGLTERYNSVFINSSAAPSTESDQRAFSFDVIPSNMIDNILVYKTPAPELPTDFAGAAIRIYTKNTTDDNHLNLSYQSTFLDGTTLQDFYGYEGSPTDFLGFDNGTRQLPASVPSTEEMFVLQDFSDGTDPAIIAQRKQELTRIARDFQEVSTASKTTALPDNKISFDISFLKRLNKLKISNISSFNYKYGYSSNSIYRAAYESYDVIKDSSTYVYQHTDNTYSQNVQLGGIHNWSVGYKNTLFEFRNLFNQIGKSKVTYRDGFDYYRNGNHIQSYELAYMSRTLYSGQLVGAHTLVPDKQTLTWNLGYSYAFKDEPDTRRIYTYATRYTDENGIERFRPFQLDYAATVNTESNGRLFAETKENIYNLGIDYSYKFAFGGLSPEIKAGLFAEYKDRSFDLRTFGIALMVPQSSFNSNLYYQPLDSIYADTNFNVVNGLKILENTAPEYSYQASNQNYAAYIGLKIPIGNKLVFYGGGRVENFKRKLTGFQDPEDLEPEPDIISDTLKIYPSINLTYNFNNKSLVRVSYGETVNRPEYREIAPYAFYDFEISSTVYGNRTLKDSYVKNIDARFEYYPTLSDMMSLGVFYKDFVNPIELNLFPASNGWDFVAVNSVRAYNFGAEVEIRKSLQELRGGAFTEFFLRNLTVSLNAAYIKGQVEKENDYVRDKKRDLFGQSPYIVNAGLFYQNEENGLGVNILYNVIGPRIVVVGTPAIPNVLEQSRHLLDLSLSKKIGSFFSIKAGIKDLLNSEVIYRQTFDVEIEGVNQTRTQDMRRFIPGRTFSITVSYGY